MEFHFSDSDSHSSSSASSFTSSSSISLPPSSEPVVFLGVNNIHKMLNEKPKRSFTLSFFLSVFLSVSVMERVRNMLAIWHLSHLGKKYNFIQNSIRQYFIFCVSVCLSVCLFVCPAFHSSIHLSSSHCGSPTMMPFMVDALMLHNFVPTA